MPIWVQYHFTYNCCMCAAETGGTFLMYLDHWTGTVVEDWHSMLDMGGEL